MKILKPISVVLYATVSLFLLESAAAFSAMPLNTHAMQISRQRLNAPAQSAATFSPIPCIPPYSRVSRSLQQKRAPFGSTARDSRSTSTPLVSCSMSFEGAGISGGIGGKGNGWSTRNGIAGGDDGSERESEGGRMRKSLLRAGLIVGGVSCVFCLVFHFV